MGRIQNVFRGDARRPALPGWERVRARAHCLSQKLLDMHGGGKVLSPPPASARRPSSVGVRPLLSAGHGTVVV